VYTLAIKENLDKKFKKLQKKDKELLRVIEKKVRDILEDIIDLSVKETIAK
jgi:hypothetical protein